MKNQSKPRTFNAIFVPEHGNVLGPYPALAVATLADLGLTDQEIAHYFRVLPERITRLRLKDAPELRLVCDGDAATTRAPDQK
jgi:hypothetical protein